MVTEQEIRQQSQQSAVESQRREQQIREAQQRYEREQQTQQTQQSQPQIPQEKSPTIIAFETLYYGGSPSSLSGEALNEYVRLQEDSSAYQSLKRDYRQSGSVESSRLQSYGMSGGEKTILIRGQRYVKVPVTTSEQRGSTPFGYSPSDVVDVYSKYQKQLTPEQRRLSQIDQNEIITTNPNYQREIQAIYNQPEQATQMKKYEKVAGFGGAFTGTSKTSYSYSGKPSGVISYAEKPSIFRDPLGRIIRNIRETNTKNLVQVNYTDGTTGYVSKQEAYRLKVSKSSFKDLYKQGNIPALVTKGFFETGGLFFTGTETLRTNILGGTELSPEQKERGGEIVGEGFEWGFFSPAISTGAVAKAEQIKLSESQFKALEDFYAGVEKGLLESKAGKEQNEFLAKVYKNYFKGKPEGKEAFKKMLEDLYKKDVYKGIPLEFIEQAQKETPILWEITAEVPYMRGSGITGFASQTPEQLGQQLSDKLSPFSAIKGTEANVLDVGQQEYDVLGVKDIGKQKNKYDVIGKVWVGSKEVSKSRQGQTTALGLLSMLKTKQDSGQAQQTKQTQTPRQASGSAFAQAMGLKQAQKQSLKQKSQQKETSRNKNIRRLRLFLPSGKGREKTTARESLKDLFKVYGRRFGEDTEIGTAESEFGAKRKLKSFLIGGLGRSGFVTSKEGEKLDINLGWGFRPSKTRKKVVVQESWASLGSAGERKEIQYFRKLKGKKKKFSWF